MNNGFPEPHPTIQHTKNWIQKVVIGLNFCPFAAKPFLKDAIRYTIHSPATLQSALEQLARELDVLDHQSEITTGFLIFPDGFADFFDYLDLVELAEELLADLDYEGVYQVASFHPDYQFAGNEKEDPANYTNRSPYPMLHLIREDSITEALEHFSDPENIPEQNRLTAQEKGLATMKALRKSCFENPN
ncbi:MAG: DUF1415 domain-containing protein [Saprospiraceae bacterium]|nr:DUF1415 domain-containing protein [Saprospiraceae bacterium]